jgi:hypothetical protein
MVGDLIEQRFGVQYHNHHIPWSPRCQV